MEEVHVYFQEIARNLEFELHPSHFDQISANLMGIQRRDAIRTDHVDEQVMDVFGTMRAINIFGRLEYLDGVYWEALNCIVKFILQQKRFAHKAATRLVVPGRSSKESALEIAMDTDVSVEIDSPEIESTLALMEFEMKDSFKKCWDVSKKYAISSIEIWKRLDSFRWEIIRETATPIPLDILKIVNNFF